MSKRIQQEDRIYDYKESDRLGSGNFADVYKGVLQKSNEEVAIKVIRK